MRVYFSVTLKSGDEESAGAFSKLMYKFDGSMPGCWWPSPMNENLFEISIPGFTSISFVHVTFEIDFPSNKTVYLSYVTVLKQPL